MRARVIAVALLGALVVPASAHAQKPFFDIRRAEAPQLQSTRPMTAPASGDRVAHALAFARGHARALGLTAARVEALGAPQRNEVAGIEQLRWRRSFHGIPAADDELRVVLGTDGAVLSASGTASHGAPASLTPALSAAQAMAVVSDDAGAAGRPSVLTGPRGPRRTTTFGRGGVARLVVFGSRLAWRVDYRASPRAFYDTMVDAATGAILRRANLVRSDAPLNAEVWDDFPGSPLTPTHTVNLADYGLSAAATTLQNAWMHVYTDVNADDTLEAGEEVQPGMSGWDFPFVPFGSCAKPCGWDPSQPTSWQTNRSQDAVEAFYLANLYREHLAQAPFDFDGFKGTDTLNIETDWGAVNSDDPDAHSEDFDNSSMYTLPPGYIDENGVSHSTLALSLFGVTFHDSSSGQPTTLGFRAVNAGDDASIVFHEYTHGFDNRTVVDGDGFEALNTHQAWALDEASADFFAKSFLVDTGRETDTGTVGDVDMGNYTDATRNSIRAEPLDCPAGTQSAACPGGGYTYADFGKISGFGAEPHFDGEIWSETMWDLRNALGPQLTEQLAAQAFRLVPPEPSFLDMRDAILEADANLGYNDAATIWQVFAHRGMGCDATTNGSDDKAPHAGFTVAPCPAPAVTPTPTAVPTVSPTATPAPTSTPTPAPAPKRPSFTLQRSGRRAVKFAVTCRAACSVTGTLSVSRSVAKRLHLGSRRTVGTLKAKLNAAGHKKFTVRLSAAAARALKRAKPVKSFKATLTARAVYPGAASASKHGTVTVRR